MNHKAAIINRLVSTVQQLGALVIDDQDMLLRSVLMPF